MIICCVVSGSGWFILIFDILFFSITNVWWVLVESAKCYRTWTCELVCVCVCIYFEPSELEIVSDIFYFLNATSHASRYIHIMYMPKCLLIICSYRFKLISTLPPWFWIHYHLPTGGLRTHSLCHPQRSLSLLEMTVGLHCLSDTGSSWQHLLCLPSCAQSICTSQ